MTTTHASTDLITLRPQGLYCAAGDFYIDPWRPVPMAVITHAHGDHLRSGHERYLCSTAGQHVVRARAGEVSLQTLAYGEPLLHNGVRISLHPAGHVLGSAQVRLEHGGQVWVASGDYKTGPDRTCPAFEAVPCHVFITESTFGLPVFRWQAQQAIEAEINQWWAGNAAQGKCSVLYAYSFGKAQRILAGVDAGIGPIVAHGAMTALNKAYAASGVLLPPTLLTTQASNDDLRRALVLAPPSAQGSAWVKRFGEHSDAFASGWMQLRGTRRRRGLDRGFVLSDHADWPGLLEAVRGTGAERVIVTHGYVDPLVRYFSEQGLQAESFKTEYGTQDDEASEADTAAPSAESAAPP
jgi:putative mRNA 3-end processing factor